MCHQCNYPVLLKQAGLASTSNRLKVLEVIGTNTSPVSAGEIYFALKRKIAINRVTVYRILDLLVDRGIVDRISGGGRAFFYGLAPNENHQPHSHFYCKTCGNIECLNPESLVLDASTLQRTYPGMIENVEIRVDGVCKNCMRSEQATPPKEKKNSVR
jgi:Fur family ferric uptake transcriptional regulator